MVAGGERGNIISFSELDWVETRRWTGRQEEEGRESHRNNKLDIGKLIAR